LGDYRRVICHASSFEVSGFWRRRRRREDHALHSKGQMNNAIVRCAKSPLPGWLCQKGTPPLLPGAPSVDVLLKVLDRPNHEPTYHAKNFGRHRGDCYILTQAGKPRWKTTADGQQR
jgi:hypothetical protein